MTNTICGHGRDVLIWVLSVHVRERCLMAPCELSETEAQSASDAVHDPAKLAEMLAARGRELGFFVGIAVDMYCRGPIFGARSTSADSIKVWVRPVANEPSRSTDCDLDMPQARAFALALLDAPNATAQDIERMIGEAK